MNVDSHSILIIGFNTRPLVYSLYQAGYDVFAVDFFGDLDLYPFVKDSLIISKELNATYNTLKGEYDGYLIDFAIKMYRLLVNREWFR